MHRYSKTLPAKPNPSTVRAKNQRYHDIHFSPPTTTPLIKIETYSARIIISVIWRRLDAWAILYGHCGYITSLHRICIRYDIKKYNSVYMHRIIAIRFDWRYHIRRRTIYMYSSLGFTLLASKNPPSHPKHTWDMHKNIEYYYIPTRSLFCIPTTLPSIKRPMMIDIRINLIYVQY